MLVAGTGTQLLITIASAMGAISGIALAVSKLADILTKRRGDRRQWEREDFEAALDALKDENARCWTDNARLQTTIADQRVALEALEARLQVRRDNEHRLNNLLASYVLRFGEIEAELDENGDPK